MVFFFFEKKKRGFFFQRKKRRFFCQRRDKGRGFFSKEEKGFFFSKTRREEERVFFFKRRKGDFLQSPKRRLRTTYRRHESSTLEITASRGGSTINGDTLTPPELRMDPIHDLDLICDPSQWPELISASTGGSTTTPHD